MTSAFATPGRPPAPPFGSGPYGQPPRPSGTLGGRRPMRRFAVSLAIGLLVGFVELLVLMSVGDWIGPVLTILLRPSGLLGHWT